MLVRENPALAKEILQEQELLVRKGMDRLHVCTSYVERIT